MIRTHQKTLYELLCDKCSRQYEDSEGSWLWFEEDIVVESAEDNDWVLDETTGKIYCEHCVPDSVWKERYG